MLVEKSTLAKLTVTARAENLFRAKRDRTDIDGGSEAMVEFYVTIGGSNVPAVFSVPVSEEIYHSVNVGDEVHLIHFKEES